MAALRVMVAVLIDRARDRARAVLAEERAAAEVAAEVALVEAAEVALVKAVCVAKPCVAKPEVKVWVNT